MKIVPVERFIVQLAAASPPWSVTLPVKLSTSIFLGEVVLKEVLTAGGVASATVKRGEVCFTLLEVSVAYMVKLSTQVSAQLGREVTLLTWAEVPERV